MGTRTMQSVTKPTAGSGNARATLTLLAVEARTRLQQGPSSLPYRPALLAIVVDPTGRDRAFALSVVVRHVAVPVHRVDMSAVVQGEQTKNSFTRLFFAAERAGVVLYFDHADALFNAPTVDDAHPFGRFEPDFLLRRLNSFAGVVIAAVHRREMIAGPLLQRARHVVDFTPTSRAPQSVPEEAGD